jgi:uncharacterized membrane protein YbhN (UPF0104 family)
MSYFRFSSSFFFYLSFLSIFKSFGIEINIYKLLLIYLLFAFSTQIKVLPKNIGIDELIGTYLMQIGSGSFVEGLLVMVSIRLVNLICTLFLFLVTILIKK